MPQGKMTANILRIVAGAHSIELIFKGLGRTSEKMMKALDAATQKVVKPFAGNMGTLMNDLKAYHKLSVTQKGIKKAGSTPTEMVQLGLGAYEGYLKNARENVKTSMVGIVKNMVHPFKQAFSGKKMKNWGIFFKEMGKASAQSTKLSIGFRMMEYMVALLVEADPLQLIFANLQQMFGIIGQVLSASTIPIVQALWEIFIQFLPIIIMVANVIQTVLTYLNQVGLMKPLIYGIIIVIMAVGAALLYGLLPSLWGLMAPMLPFILVAVAIGLVIWGIIGIIKFFINNMELVGRVIKYIGNWMVYIWIMVGTFIFNFFIGIANFFIDILKFFGVSIKNIPTYATPSVPKFESGTNYVERTGLAILHKGEEVRPAQAVQGYEEPTPNINITINGDVDRRILHELVEKIYLESLR